MARAGSLCWGSFNHVSPDLHVGAAVDHVARLDAVNRVGGVRVVVDGVGFDLISVSVIVRMRFRERENDAE